MGIAISLAPSKKWTSDGTSRVIQARETLEKVLPIADKIGISRLADITHMDRLKIPNYSAVLPGTEDYIWVYSGKGPTHEHAKASAIMESIERYSSLPSNFKGEIIQGTFRELAKNNNILDVNDLVEPLVFSLTEHITMDYIKGFDIQNNEEILVPASVALFRYTPKSPAIDPLAYHHTNGLASGNTVEEAVCHSLCEVIERDAISLAELYASAIPFSFLKKLILLLQGQGYNIPNLKTDEFKDDLDLFPDVDLESINFEIAKKLIRKFKKNNIQIRVKDITSKIEIPTFIATSIDWVTHDYGYIAEGHGTHPDARLALVRAITEVSQTRAANIQGARDDLRKIYYGHDHNDYEKTWQFAPSNKIICFSQIKSYENRDILDDINLILSKLKSNRLDKTIIVNLTNPDINIPVVRAIVPGLETFKITKSVIGRRAKEYAKEWK